MTELRFGEESLRTLNEVLLVLKANALRVI